MARSQSVKIGCSGAGMKSQKKAGLETVSAPASRGIRVAAVQMESKAGDKEANFSKIEAFVKQAAEQKVELIVFPECCITGYWFIRNLKRADLAKLAEPIFGGESSRRLTALSQKQKIIIGAGLLETGDEGYFHNSYVVALPDGTAHRHRKLQAFEHPKIKSGSDYTVFDTAQGFRVGVLICY